MKQSRGTLLGVGWLCSLLALYTLIFQIKKVLSIDMSLHTFKFLKFQKSEKFWKCENFWKSEKFWKLLKIWTFLKEFWGLPSREIQQDLNVPTPPSQWPSLWPCLRLVKTQNSSTKLKVLANLVKTNAENKANKSKNEGQIDWNGKYRVITMNWRWKRQIWKQNSLNP